MIHLNPVGVSADGCPAAPAITCISEPLTSDDAYVPRAPRRSSQSARSAPTSSPVSCRPPQTTAQRSASGSSAMATSAPTRSASALSRSVAPGSSGFGKVTVGKAGSGTSCSGTLTGAASPAAAKTARVVSAPTPCIAV